MRATFGTFGKRVVRLAASTARVGALVGALAFGAGGLGACVEIENPEDPGDAGDASGAGDSAGSDAPASPDVRAADEATAGPEGADLTLLGGEVRLTIPAGAFDQTVDLQVTRDLVTVGDRTELLGYIWGPHGLPIEPPARLTVTLALERWPSDAGDPSSARLYRERDGQLEPLTGAAVTVDAVRVVVSGDLPVLGTVVVSADVP